MDDAPQQVVDALMAAFAELSGNAEPALETLTHRWLYALRMPVANLSLATSGSPASNWGWPAIWLSGGRIEGACNSAVGLVNAIGGSEQA